MEWGAHDEIPVPRAQALCEMSVTPPPAAAKSFATAEQIFMGEIDGQSDSALLRHSPSLPRSLRPLKKSPNYKSEIGLRAVAVDCQKIGRSTEDFLRSGGVEMFRNRRPTLEFENEFIRNSQG